ILIGAGVAALGGFALYDYNSPDSRRARALHDVETLKPDVKPHSCLPPGPLSRAFAVAVALDAVSPTTFDSDARKRGTIKHDCIRGASQHSTLDRLLDASGEDLVAYAAKVVESCPYVKNEYPVPECVALDVLGIRAEKSPAAGAALELVNPGKCVVEDEGRAEDGTCRYVCREQNQRLRYPKEKGPCPLVRPPDPLNAGAKPPVNSAALTK